MTIQRLDCLPHDKLIEKDDATLLDYTGSLLWYHLEMYLDLSFFDQRSIVRGEDLIQINLQKSALYLPLHSSSVQHFSLDICGGKVKCQYEVVSNPHQYTGIPDCLNDYGERHQVFNFVFERTGAFIQSERYHGSEPGNFITILDKNTHYDVYITTGGQQGRCSVDKNSGQVFGVMHTLLTKKNRTMGLPGY